MLGTGEIMAYTINALWLTLILSMPPIAVATMVGTLVALLQALTQIQEQNIAFAFKLVAITITLYATGTWLGSELFQFTVYLFELIEKVRF